MKPLLQRKTAKLLRLGSAQAWLAPLVTSLFFLIAGLVLIPHPGMQNDELFFSGPIFDPATAFYSITAGSMKIPIMVTSYTGALKTWLYAGIFQFFQPDVWSVRVPVLLMGVITIWLTWAWVRRIAGTPAAIVATALLSTDTLFLMTDIFDWGPVAIQHLLLMGGLASVSRWIGTDRRKWLALGFFLWGLGMWDKALLSWPLIGLSVASLIVYPRHVLLKLRAPAALVASSAFLMGILPLLVFNVATRGQTATANAKISSADLPNRLAVLRQTIDGSSLFGYIVQVDDSVTHRRTPARRIERASIRLANLVGPRESNWMIAAWIAGLICFCSLWGTGQFRLLVFLLTVIVVTWLQMALTRGAGSAAHHVILIWPFPAVFLGVAFAAMAQRSLRAGPPVVAAAVALLVLGNVLNTNQYLRELIINGPAGGWTDAIYPLSDSFPDDEPEWIGLVDWGYLNALQMFHDGKLKLFEIDLNVNDAEIKRIVNPNFLFIQHTPGKEIVPGVNRRFSQMAEHLGFVERTDRTIYDSGGNAVFDVFRFYRSQ